MDQKLLLAMKENLFINLHVRIKLIYLNKYFLYYLQIFLIICLVSLTQKNRSDKIKARIAEKKEKRMIENKILNVKKLADSDSEEDTVSWVNKTKTIQEEMEKAKKKVNTFFFQNLELFYCCLCFGQIFQLCFCFVKRPKNWKKWTMYLAQAI